MAVPTVEEPANPPNRRFWMSNAFLFSTIFFLMAVSVFAIILPLTLSLLKSKQAPEPKQTIAQPPTTTPDGLAEFLDSVYAPQWLTEDSQLRWSQNDESYIRCIFMAVKLRMDMIRANRFCPKKSNRVPEWLTDDHSFAWKCKNSSLPYLKLMFGSAKKKIQLLIGYVEN